MRVLETVLALLLAGCAPSFQVVPMRLRGLDAELRPDGQVLIDGKPMCGRFEGRRVVDPDGSERYHLTPDGRLIGESASGAEEPLPERFARDGLVLRSGALLRIQDDGTVIVSSPSGKTEPTGLRVDGFAPEARRAALVMIDCVVQVKTWAALGALLIRSVEKR